MDRAYLPAALRPEGRNMLVRLGSRFDGGYVVAAGQLDGARHLLSLGLGYDCNFERDFLVHGDLKSLHGFDHTVTNAKIMFKTVRSISKFFLDPSKTERLVVAYRSYRHVFGSGIGKHFVKKITRSGGNGGITFQGALAGLASETGDIFLKCDIEGGEYEIAEAVLENSHRFCGLAFEYHDLHHGMDAFVAFIKRLQRDFVIDFTHVNNNSRLNSAGVPDVVEITLSRRDMPFDCERTGERRALVFSSDPLQLSTPNDPQLSDFDVVYQ